MLLSYEGMITYSCCIGFFGHDGCRKLGKDCQKFYGYLWEVTNLRSVICNTKLTRKTKIDDVAYRMPYAHAASVNICHIIRIFKSITQNHWQNNDTRYRYKQNPNVKGRWFIILPVCSTHRKIELKGAKIWQKSGLEISYQHDSWSNMQHDK